MERYFVSIYLLFHTHFQFFTQHEFEKKKTFLCFAEEKRFVCIDKREMSQSAMETDLVNKS